MSPYFQGLRKFASLELLEIGIYKLPVKMRKIKFEFNPVFCIIALHEYSVHLTNNPFFYLGYTFKLMMVFKNFTKLNMANFVIIWHHHINWALAFYQPNTIQ